jgi:hypothetical protein
MGMSSQVIITRNDASGVTFYSIPTRESFGSLHRLRLIYFCHLLGFKSVKVGELK